ncbi:hypothetical protein H7H78_11700 [Mycobacterium shinjukuense]|uniref:Uncharacterized protein n=1 Tax=Mycobacterium shinjukuense TaxID=398694 RepID=A0A7I7MIU7_9MYCO|nr:hypothetical protein [Mycobacterium shinjukuense]MCV6986071.1 hypothetical protein [Mycobacterium shinjukuense]ORB70081.1 hypothetical protein BST45_07320 [Mycobacterium shinjukuense]BBX72281.1 hypothetical protein MSHI_01870 [Mycobacterium shinjukuense]
MNDTTDTAPIVSTEDETPTDAEPSSEEQQSDETDSDSDQPEEQPQSFPREVVEQLRKENGKYRQRAQQADALARRLHTELVRATGRLADPTDLVYAEEHLDDPDALSAAIDDLLATKPHLASRRPTGDIGQGNRGSSAQPFSLLQMLKERT